MAEVAFAARLSGPAGTHADAAGPPAPAEAVAEAIRPSSEAALQMSEWVAASGNNGGLPFIVIDKFAAAVFVFDPEGEFLGETPALLGIAMGDESTPGIGERALSEMGPEEKTTPAGRFAAHIGVARGGHRVLWVDYTLSVALHPVVTGNRRERRLQRLRSRSPDDNRITFGCINVPARFYANLVGPLFREAGGIVYILPEITPVEEVFPNFRFQASSRATNAH
jgi:hypothetical protein